MSEAVIKTINIDSEEKKEKDGYNEENNLNGDFEKYKVDNDEKEIDDYKNKQLMETDNEKNDKVNKNVMEEDNGAINKLKEIDNVSNIENHVENEIPLIKLDDEDDDTLIIKVIKKEYVSDNDETVIDDNHEKLELGGNMIKDALLPKDNEQIDENDNAVERDNGAINKLKEIGNVSNTENHEENEIPLIKLDNEEKKEKEGYNEEKDLNEVFKNNTKDNDKKEMDNYKNKQLMEIDDEKNNKVNKNVVEKDNGAINKLKEIDNVSNTENHNENEIPLIKLDDDYDTLIINVVKKEYDTDNDETVADENPEKLDLEGNIIKDALLPKDNKQKSENDADGNPDEQELKLFECDDNSKEEIPKKRKKDNVKGPQKRTKSN
ncbi:MATH and LRR domain-containing protein PFE0570w-like [Acyrthosiphon pisum]|uniref:Uncharacterized protein n=1 Tax=Acyrthosiphon pisum TaxID=7029 RepID=A0A8R2JUS8_ACYPI|nr:MATH and LRR domain-containing protein PFE0570w-like [Acyrthosiphon pisum]